MASLLSLSLGLAFLKGILFSFLFSLYRILELSILSRLLLGVPIIFIFFVKYQKLFSAGEGFSGEELWGFVFFETIFSLCSVFFLNALVHVFDSSINFVWSYFEFPRISFLGEGALSNKFVCLLFVLIFFYNGAFESFLEVYSIQPSVEVWKGGLENFVGLVYSYLSGLSVLFLKVAAPYIVLLMLFKLLWNVWILGTSLQEGAVFPQALAIFLFFLIFIFSFDDFLTNSSMSLANVFQDLEFVGQGR